MRTRPLFVAAALGALGLTTVVASGAAVGAESPCSVTCYVSPEGNDANTGADDTSAKLTIQAAIDQVNVDGTVIVAAGTYEEQVTVTKPLSLLGPNSAVSGMGTRVDEAIVQFPTEAANGSSLIFVNPNVHGVTISGLDLRAQDSTIPNYHYLVRAGTFSAGDPRNDLTISNNRMYSSEIPIYLLAGFGTKGGSGLLIEGNYIDGGPNVNSSYGRGIYAGGTSGTIQDNVIVNANVGIQYMPYDNAGQGLIQRNIVTANNIGLYNNYQTLGAGPVTWQDNEVCIAPNDRTGSKAEVDGAWTSPLNFRGIFAFTFGVVGTGGSGSAPQAFFLDNKLDGSTTSTFYSGTTGFGSGSTGQTNGQGTATLTGNSFQNFETFAYNYSTEAKVFAASNWWGTTDETVISEGIEGDVVFLPILTSNPLPNACGSDDEAPVVTNVVATPNPAEVGTTVTLTAVATDNVAVTAASYTIDGGTPDAFTVAPGSPNNLSVSLAGLVVGVYELCVTAEDAAGNVSNTECAQLAVYDPSAGFVTGGGWFISPAGAFAADPALTGRANFGFVSRYQKGASIPTGNTLFQFQAGSLSFSSTSYEWLVVNRGDTTAQYKGNGTVTINGAATPGASFMLWAQDGSPDLFRIKISAPNGDLIYDNKIGSEFGTALSGGNIIVHTKR